jgi:hypothetical protein
VIHEVEFDGPRVCDYAISAASGNGIYSEAEERRAYGQGYGLPFVQHGFESLIASNDIEIRVGDEVRGTVCE